MDQQYYFHHEMAGQGWRSLATPYRIGTISYLCIAAGSSIQIYRLHHNSLVFQSRLSLSCNLVRIEAIPSRHQDRDYLFLVDELGRWAFWDCQNAPIIGSDGIAREQLQSQVYQILVGGSEDLHFGGKFCSFNVKDTRGCIFYTVGHKIVTIDFHIKHLGPLLEEWKTKQYRVPYAKYRFAGWISNKGSKLLGIVEEREQRTILNVHNLEMGLTAESVDWKLEKQNILEFVSQVKNQLLLACYGEVALYNYKNNRPICTYRVRRGYGQICYLMEGIYGHLSDELTIFSHQKIKAYGPLKRGEKSILPEGGPKQFRLISLLENGGRMISVATLTNEFHVIILHENQWKLVQSFRGLAAVFSVHPVQDSRDSVVAVTGGVGQNFEVCLLERQSACEVKGQQVYEFVIEGFLVVGNGQFLIVTSRQIVVVMRWQSTAYNYCFSLPSGQIFTASQSLLATENAIFVVDFERQEYSLLLEDKIILAQSGINGIIFANSEGEIKYIDAQTHTISLLRSQCYSEYCWSWVGFGQIIAVASLDTDGKINIYSEIKNLYSTVILRRKQIVSSLGWIRATSSESGDMINEEELHLVVGYLDGNVEIYNLKSEIIAQFRQHCSQPTTFVRISQERIAILSGTRQYILHFHGEYHLDQVRFSQVGGTINLMVWSSIARAFLFLEDCGRGSQKIILSALRGVDLSTRSEASAQMQFACVISSLCGFIGDIPMVVVSGHWAYVAVKQQVSLYDIRTKNLVKRQSHILKEVIGAQATASGLLLCGVDLLDCTIGLIFSYKDLEIVATLHFNPKENRIIRAFKTVNKLNKIIIRYDRYICLYEVSDNFETIQILEFKIDIDSCTLSLNQSEKLMVLCDGFRYSAVFHLAENICPLARHLGAYELNDAVFLDNSIITGNKGGGISILQMDFNHPVEVFRTSMTEVGSVNLGEQVFALAPTLNGSLKKVFYGSTRGRVGSVQLIDRKRFQILKRAEELITKRKNVFSYQKWRKRKPQVDKLIDGQLIRMYLEEGRIDSTIGGEADYQQVRIIYRKLTG